MGDSGQTLMFLGGGVAVVGIFYYLHKAGYFNQIFDAINAAIDKIKNTNPLPSGNGDTTPTPTPTPAKITCKDGKQDTQANCDKQAGCKSTEHWDATTKKCVKSSSLAMAFSTKMMGRASYRGYLVR